ncbi:hypothetical protein [uncultured Spirosoma sp.]|uniref:hypothetical protein n=1 Tax=uncultured Spirosoma sp. TaxID=278208 RepID=UPI00258803B1|nr:hypothetical protein [uncultured Spirosoma sp.]
MKKVFALLFIGSTLTFAACQSKPKTEETTTDSTVTTMSTDTTTMATDSAVSATVTTTESVSAAADSAK